MGGGLDRQIQRDPDRGTQSKWQGVAGPPRGTKRPGDNDPGEKGEAVLRRLQALDQVAYIRYASVYRQFADIDDLRREVEGLKVPGETADDVKG